MTTNTPPAELKSNQIFELTDSLNEVALYAQTLSEVNEMADDAHAELRRTSPRGLWEQMSETVWCSFFDQDGEQEMYRLQLITN